MGSAGHGISEIPGPGVVKKVRMGQSCMLKVSRWVGTDV